MKILYEYRLEEIEEIEDTHVHLKDGTVIRNSEIIKTPWLWFSRFSQKKETRRLRRWYRRLFSRVRRFCDRESRKNK